MFLKSHSSLDNARESCNSEAWAQTLRDAGTRRSSDFLFCLPRPSSLKRVKSVSLSARTWKGTTAHLVLDKTQDVQYCTHSEYLCGTCSLQVGRYQNEFTFLPLTDMNVWRSVEVQEMDGCREFTNLECPGTNIARALTTEQISRSAL